MRGGLTIKAVLVSCHIIAGFLILQGCASTSVSDTRAGDISSNSQGSNRKKVNGISIPPQGKITEGYVRRGLQLLREGSYEAAEREFGKTLRYDPQNSAVHFLNGFAYHLIAERSNPDQYEYARIGYELALKFDPNNWLAAQQLARLWLSTREYRRAQEYFAYALLYRPNDASLLYGLAQASYYLSDIETALGAVRRAAELKPRSPEIVSGYAMIAAAAGQRGISQEMLAAFREQEPDSIRLAMLEERIGEWNDVYSRPMINDPEVHSACSDISTARGTSVVRPDSSMAVVEQPKMVMIDVAMLRTEENETSNKGLNLLENLSLTFEGKFDSPAPVGDVWTVPTRRLIGTLDIPQVNYGINIFNAGGDRTEVLALPTLIALDGKQSTSFAGATLNVAVKGVQTASISVLDAGITLEVLPMFLSDNIIQLHVVARRTFVETGAVGSFQEAVRTSKNEVTADVVLNIGETLVLSGLREKETSTVKSGVPLLGDIPILQYLFSTEATVDFHKSVLILITPRQVSAGIYRSGTGNQIETTDSPKLRDFRKRYGYILSLDDNITHLMRHLDKHEVARSSDLFDRQWWGDPESIDTMLRRIASFLYY